MKILKQIEKDLKNKNFMHQLLNETEDNLISFHFSIGLYIRNTYLQNKKNILKLSKYFKIENVDGLSMQVIKYFYKKYKQY